MKHLSLILLCSSACALFAASSEQKKLPLVAKSLAYFQNSLNDEYVPAIEKGNFSKTSGLSGAFYEMQQVTAQKIDQDTEAQKIAVQLWDIVDKDPAYKVLVSALVALRTSKNSDDDQNKPSTDPLMEMVNIITVQVRKDIQLGVNQRGCYVCYPMQDLNKFLGLQSDMQGIMELYNVNKDFSAQKQKKLVWASALAQCYSTQKIMQILAEKDALSHLLAVMANLGTSNEDSSK